MTRLIRVAPGIGDNVWVLQKLINANEKFDFHMSDAKPQRGKLLFDLLPQVTNSCSYVPGLPYSTIRTTSAMYDGVPFSSITDKSFSLAINHHLESGKRIEEFLPDLPMQWQLPYAIPEKTTTILGHSHKIGIYVSCYSTNRGWGFWNEREWFDFVQKIYTELPDAGFFFIGAQWDIDLTSKVIKLCAENGIEAINCLGYNLSQSISVMQELDYFIGFPSGMCMINETLHKKTFMFYPWHLKNMMYAWAEEDRIKNYDYIAQLFTTPQLAFRVLAEQSRLI